MYTDMPKDITFFSNKSRQILYDRHREEALLSDTVTLAFDITFYIILSSAFGIFGTGANIINIIVFIRQGLFSGGSTLTLFFLSFVDLGVVFTSLLNSIGSSMIVVDIKGLPFDLLAVVYLAAGWPHAIFVLGNRIMTAFIAFERCTCVALPFHVQFLFTPRKSLAYISIIFAYTFLSHVPIYLTNKLEFQNQEIESGQGVIKNVTKLVLTYGPNRNILHDIVSNTNYLFLSFASVVIVFVCTIVTSAHINTSKKWRKTASNASSAINASTITSGSSNSNGKDEKPEDSISKNTKNKRQEIKPTKAAVDKEAKLVKMIVTISIIFLVCFVPSLVVTVSTFVDNRIRTNGQYHRLAHLLFSINFVTGTLNSSINIFVYFAMSSNYRKVFLASFRREKVAN